MSLRRTRRGATLLEYGLVVALIAIVVIGALVSLGNSAAEPFNTATSSLDGTSAEGGPGPSTPIEYELPVIVSSGTTTAGGSGSAEMPAGIAAGDLAIWQMFYSDSGVNGGPPVIPGWELAYYDSQSGNSRGIGQALYYRFLDGTETGTQAASWNGEVELTRISVYRGVDSMTPFDSTGLASGIGTSTRSLPAMTTTGNNRLLVCFGGHTDDLALDYSGETGGDWVEMYESHESGGSSDSDFYAYTAEMPEPGTIIGATGGSYSWPWLARCLALTPGIGEPSSGPAGPFLRVSGSVASGSSGSAALPAGGQVGDVALWFMGYNNGSTGAIAGPPVISGWTLLDHDEATGSSHRVALALYYRVLDGSETPGTISASWNGNVDLAWIDIWGGVDSADPFGPTTTGNGPSGQPIIPDVTTTALDQLVLAYGIHTQDNAIEMAGATGGTYQLVHFADENGGSDSNADLWLAEMPAPGTISGAKAPSNGYPWLYRVITLNPAP